MWDTLDRLGEAEAGSTGKGPQPEQETGNKVEWKQMLHVFPRERSTNTISEKQKTTQLTDIWEQVGLATKI